MIQSNCIKLGRYDRDSVHISLPTPHATANHLQGGLAKLCGILILKSLFQSDKTLNFN